MKKLTKRFMGIVMAVLMVLCTSVSAFAAAPQNNISTASMMRTFSVNDVKALEPFVSVKNGMLVLDVRRALKCGMNADLVKGQLEYFDYINGQVRKGDMAINFDLTIVNKNENLRGKDHSHKAAGHWSSCGGGINTEATMYWWGYARYACDCETREMSADFSTCCSVAEGAAALCGVFGGGVSAIPGGISAAYFGLLASRLTANNHGRGVYIEMTWVWAFDITPQ